MTPMCKDLGINKLDEVLNLIDAEEMKMQTLYMNERFEPNDQLPANGDNQDERHPQNSTNNDVNSRITYGDRYYDFLYKLKNRIRDLDFLFANNRNLYIITKSEHDKWMQNLNMKISKLELELELTNQRAISVADTRSKEKIEKYKKLGLFKMLMNSIACIKCRASP